MGNYDEQIDISVNLYSKTSKDYDKLEKKLGDLTQKVEIQNKGFFRQQRIETKTQKLRDGTIKQTKKLTVGSKQFKMEYLGLMFAGMALNRTFGSFNRLGEEMLGITSFLSTAFSILSMQSIIGLADVFYSAGEAIIDFAMAEDEASKTVKSFIGGISLISEFGGSTLAIVGQLVLALSSLSMAFPGVSTIAGPLVGSMITGLGAMLNTISGLPTELKLLGGGLGAIGAVLAAQPAIQAAENAGMGSTQVAATLGAAGIGTAIAMSPSVFDWNNEQSEAMKGMDDVKSSIIKKLENWKAKLELQYQTTGVDGTIILDSILKPLDALKDFTLPNKKQIIEFEYINAPDISGTPAGVIAGVQYAQQSAQTHVTNNLNANIILPSSLLDELKDSVISQLKSLHLI